MLIERRLGKNADSSVNDGEDLDYADVGGVRFTNEGSWVRLRDSDGVTVHAAAWEAAMPAGAKNPTAARRSDAQP